MKNIVNIDGIDITYDPDSDKYIVKKNDEEIVAIPSDVLDALYNAAYSEDE